MFIGIWRASPEEDQAGREAFYRQEPFTFGLLVLEVQPVGPQPLLLSSLDDDLTTQRVLDKDPHTLVFL